MDNNESGNVQKSGKWEFTLVFIGILLAIVLSLVGWYLDGYGSLPR